MASPIPVTPFQTTLAPCSFRGVPFIVEEFGGGVGRRGEEHEYPLRDIPYAEDLGRRARRWRWRAYVLGDDALAQWQNLCAALEQPGPGMLSLPDGSAVLAQVDPKQEQRYTISLDKQRKVSFELSFVEAGQILYPGTSENTQAASTASADSLDSAANSDLKTNVTAPVSEIQLAAPGGTLPDPVNDPSVAAAP